MILTGLTIWQSKNGSTNRVHSSRSHSPSRPICINVYVINAWYTYNTTNIMQYTVYVYSDVLIFTDNNTWSSWICGLRVVWLTYKSKMYITSKASELAFHPCWYGQKIKRQRCTVPQNIIEVPVTSHNSEWSCSFGLDISILHLSTIFLLGFVAVPTMWYYTIFILLQTA